MGQLRLADDTHLHSGEILVCDKCGWEFLTPGVDKMPANAVCGVFDYARRVCRAFVGRNLYQDGSLKDQAEFGAAWTHPTPVSLDMTGVVANSGKVTYAHLEQDANGKDVFFHKVRSAQVHWMSRDWKAWCLLLPVIFGWSFGGIGGHAFQVMVYKESPEALPWDGDFVDQFAGLTLEEFHAGQVLVSRRAEEGGCAGHYHEGILDFVKKCRWSFHTSNGETRGRVNDICRRILKRVWLFMINSPPRSLDRGRLAVRLPAVKILSARWAVSGCPRSRTRTHGTSNRKRPP